MSKPTALERYWAKIDTSGGPDACWPWTGSKKDGETYGFFRADGRTRLATRWGYEQLIGPIPDGHVVMHKCDFPSCMNPMDWMTGTQADNIADMVSKGRHASGDRNGSRVHPERRATGERSGRRLHPDRYPKGDEHYARLTPEKMPRGEKHGNAKLTEADVIAIRKAASEGRSSRTLAAQFGVDYTTFRNVINRKTWKHVA